MSVSTRLRDLSIRNKLVIAFATLVILFVVLGGTAIQRFAAMDASAQNLATNYALAIGYLGDIRQTVLSYRATLLRALALRDSSPTQSPRWMRRCRSWTSNSIRPWPICADRRYRRGEAVLPGVSRPNGPSSVRARCRCARSLCSGKFDEAIAAGPGARPAGQ